MTDLNEMLVFARVVARGSFSAAAREMGVPASTLSRKLDALEQRLGARLLERTTRRLRLTEAGAPSSLGVRPREAGAAGLGDARR